MIKQIDKVRKSLLHVFVPLRMVMAAMMEARADSIILYVLALFSLLYFYFYFVWLYSYSSRIKAKKKKTARFCDGNIQTMQYTTYTTPQYINQPMHTMVTANTTRRYRHHNAPSIKNQRHKKNITKKNTRTRTLAQSLNMENKKKDATIITPFIPGTKPENEWEIDPHTRAVSYLAYQELSLCICLSHSFPSWHSSFYKIFFRSHCLWRGHYPTSRLDFRIFFFFPFSY